MPKTPKNTNLQSAKKEKNDEFYTRLADIENEAKYYRSYFKGKTILCNCDDPRVSKFFYYFFAGFSGLGLKKLIATCYKNLNPDLFSQHKDEQAVYCIYDGKDRVDDVIYNLDEFLKQNEWETMKGDGDFRSEECIELLKQADVVVTNPPFSMFREYVTQLVEYDKQFLVIGNVNAITYKEIFKLIQNNKLWLGISPRSMNFQRLDGSIENVNACWFTNLPHYRRNEKLKFYKTYTPKEYPRYDNYDAIEVAKVNEIPTPESYDGVMGVPLTFLDKYNPEQFEIVGCDYDVKQGLLPELVNPSWTGKMDRGYVNGNRLYSRILIRHREGINK